ncbi:YjbH domain-containing protein [Dendrosporobacter sp. 1207_IL3150]|uniref:YjbH domain-containing protein n=1 Tax=Dendrosporobacter sp. 1207_IL3150 TaxID=3084054 RepID=UPI002FD89A67
MKKTAILFSFVSMLLTSTVSAGVVMAPSDPSSPNDYHAKIGGTGVINTPHAIALDKGGFSISYHDLTGSQTLTQANIGIGGNLEIGVTSFNLNKDDEATYGNLKYQFLKETIATPALAIGVVDISDKYGRNAYIVGSKNLPVIDTKVSIGMYQKGDNKAFASVEKTFTPLLGSKNLFPSTTLKVEYDGEDTNFGASIATVPGLKIDIGSRNGHGYAGATYVFN